MKKERLVKLRVTCLVWICGEEKGEGEERKASENVLGRKNEPLPLLQKWPSASPLSRHVSRGADEQRFKVFTGLDLLLVRRRGDGNSWRGLLLRAEPSGELVRGDIEVAWWEVELRELKLKENKFGSCVNGRSWSELKQRMVVDVDFPPIYLSINFPSSLFSLIHHSSYLAFLAPTCKRVPSFIFANKYVFTNIFILKFKNSFFKKSVNLLFHQLTKLLINLENSTR